MLFQLVDKVIRQIEVLDPKNDAPAFSSALLQMSPALFQDFLGGKNMRDLKTAAMTVAAAQIKIIKEIPLIVEFMGEAIRDRQTAPPVRCALLQDLVYLVRANDLLPDHLPGGYGLVDDCILLRTTVPEFLEVLPPGFTTAEKERQILAFLSRSVPPLQLNLVQVLVELVWKSFHICKSLPDRDAEAMARRLIEDPLNSRPAEADMSAFRLPAGPQVSASLLGGNSYYKKGCLNISFPDGGGIAMTPSGDIIGWER